MEHSPVPEAVKRAAAEHRRKHPPTTPERRAAVRGDLVILGNEDITRIACVLAVHDSHLEVALCSNAVEMATDHDVVLRRPGTYDLLLEAECRFVVLPEQVRGIVGAVDLQAVNAVRESLFTDGKSVESLTRRPLGYETGTPLGGIDDPRRTFMGQELDDVTVLRNPAHGVLFGDGWNPGYSAKTEGGLDAG